MGYNAGGTYFENHRSSGFDTVANDVSCVVELRRSKRENGNGMPTKTVFIDINVNDALRAATQECLDKFRLDGKTNEDLSATFPGPLEPCPRALKQAKNDPRFEINKQFRENCSIQKVPVSGINFNGRITYGQQCCYDDSG